MAGRFCPFGRAQGLVYILTLGVTETYRGGGIGNVNYCRDILKKINVFDVHSKGAIAEVGQRGYTAKLREGGISARTIYQQSRYQFL